MTIFIGVFFAIGFALLGYAAWATSRSNAAARWPTAPGTLEHCELKEMTDDDGPSYRVDVTYTYAVGSRPYTGTRVAFGYTATSGRTAHEDLCAKLMAAKIVDVRYDPRDPAISTLTFGVHRPLLAWWTLGIVWTLITLGVMAIAWLLSQPNDVLLKNLVTH